ncbi:MULTISPECIES: group III truncated hemoglobin [Rhodanobacter]|nr:MULTISPECIES: group III truncated hemoglobin [Rhodanobacter]UJJ52998.1 group III truncated hemoglobin [Rhodanobacter denitrificans]UJJ60528.1 group III truncated hemoglobin [Rhodanobacter denitrificans]UJM88096.1 group III truncated hemoglobin [Rhodanobacter denitrificans]
MKTIAMDSRELNSPEAIADFVDAFYAKVRVDAALGPIFKDVDLQQHIPKIRAYWRKMLLGDHEGYRRNMIAQHMALHTRHSLHHHHFQRWLALFVATVDEQFRGHAAIQAKRLASTIAVNLEALLDVRRK